MVVTETGFIRGCTGAPDSSSLLAAMLSTIPSLLSSRPSLGFAMIPSIGDSTATPNYHLLASLFLVLSGSGDSIIAFTLLTSYKKGGVDR